MLEADVSRGARLTWGGEKGEGRGRGGDEGKKEGGGRVLAREPWMRCWMQT